MYFVLITGYSSFWNAELVFLNYNDIIVITFSIFYQDKGLVRKLFQL